MTPEFRAYPVDGLDGVYVVPSRSQPGTWWQPQVTAARSLVGVCQCKAASRAWCGHREAVAAVLAEHGLVEALPGGGFGPPLPSEDGDEAAVAALLGQRASAAAAGVR